MLSQGCCRSTGAWRCCRKGAVDRRERGGVVARVLSIDGSVAVLSQGCCRSTGAWRCCRKGAVDRRERGGAVARVLSIDGSVAVLSQECCRSTGARWCCRCCHEIGTPVKTARGRANKSHLDRVSCLRIIQRFQKFVMGLIRGCFVPSCKIRTMFYTNVSHLLNPRVTTRANDHMTM